MTALVRVLTVLVGWALLGLAVLVSFEVISRKFLGFSIQGADEIGGYVLAITSAIGFSYALISRAHVRIDFIALAFPHRVRAWLDILAYAALNLFLWLLVWRAAAVTRQSIKIGALAPTPLGTPLAIPQIPWSIALLLVALLALFRLAGAVVRIARGRTDDALIELESASLQDELELEMASARARDIERRGASE